MRNYAEINVKQMCRNMKQYKSAAIIVKQETMQNEKQHRKIPSPYLPTHLVRVFSQGGRVKFLLPV